MPLDAPSGAIYPQSATEAEKTKETFGMLGKVLLKQPAGTWDQGSLYVGLDFLRGRRAGARAQFELPWCPIASHHPGPTVNGLTSAHLRSPPLTTAHLRAPPRFGRYDAIFAIRMALATCLGILCGVTGLTGLQTFVAYLAASFVVPSSWFGYQGISDPAEYDDEKQPINMEGFGQGVSLFVLVWTVSYTLKHSI